MVDFRRHFAGDFQTTAIGALVTLVVILACQLARTEDRGANRTRSVESPQVRRLATLANPDILESSGLATSLDTAHLFWTHNDSGHGPRLFAFDERGRDRGVVALAGITPTDWEDIASFRRNNSSWLLVADVGDNGRRRETYELHLLREPSLKSRTTTAYASFKFRYESGPNNCEAVAVDGATNTVLLVSKATFRCHVFALNLPAASTDSVLVARSIATISVPLATALDVSPDRERAIVLTYGNAYEFRRQGDESWAEAFAAQPQEIEMPPRRQGESICYAPDGRSLFLTSEKQPTPLWKVER